MNSCVQGKHIAEGSKYNIVNLPLLIQDYFICRGGYNMCVCHLCLFQITMKLLLILSTQALLLVHVVFSAPNSLPWLRLEAAQEVEHKSTNDILKFMPMTPLDEVWQSFKEEHGN